MARPKKRSLVLQMSNLPCPCGGTRRIASDNESDIGWLVGVPVIVRGIVVNRCDSCGETTVPGRIVEQVADLVVLELLGLARRVSGNEARFLRKSGVGMSVDQLANALDRSKKELDSWESAPSLGAAEDAALRDVILGILIARGRFEKRFDRSTLHRLRQKTSEPRSRRAPSTPQVLRIAYPFAA